MKASTRKSVPKRRRGQPRSKTVADVVHGISIREARPGVYVIQVRRKEMHVYEKFDSLPAARVRCRQIHHEREHHGLSAFNISPNERKDARAALDKLKGRASLEAAAEYWLRQNPGDSAVMIGELVDRYVTRLARANRRPVTVQDAQRRLKRFTADFDGRPVASITGGDIREWLDNCGGGPRNRNNYRKQIRAVFSYAVRAGDMLTDPSLNLDPASVDPTIPVHWSPARVEALLRAAEQFNRGMVPVLAIMAFAGLRPDEVARLDWENVNLDELLIRVLPETSKIRSMRVIEDLPGNLAAWLTGYRKASGAVAPPPMTITRWRSRLSAAATLGLDEVQRRLDWQEGKKGTEIKAKRMGWSAIVEDAKKKDKLWHQDVLRHSFATYWLAKHSDINRLAEMMGNSQQIIKAHYKGLATKNEAEQYFAIKPCPPAEQQ